MSGTVSRILSRCRRLFLQRVGLQAGKFGFIWGFVNLFLWPMHAFAVKWQSGQKGFLLAENRITNDSGATTPSSDFVADLREDLLHHDPLLACLVELTRLHGRPSTRAALTAGLPLENGSLTPSLFARAAARAGLSSRILRRGLESIDDIVLPAVLLLKGDQACVLLGWDESREAAHLLFPETGQGEIVLVAQRTERTLSRHRPVRPAAFQLRCAHAGSRQSGAAALVLGCVAGAKRGSP